MIHKLRFIHFPGLPIQGAIRLVAVLLLLLTLFCPFASLEAAPTDVQVISSSAKVRYGVGLTFSLQARTNRGQINQLELKLTYGKNTQEYPVKVSFTPGSNSEGRAEISAEDAPVAAGMPVSYYWLISNNNGDRARS